MISFDQVLLLEEKVESAVKKIEQLNAENAALRLKVEELSNALNAKSEQFTSFQSDQSKIEEGILKALNRLNAVENVILSATDAVNNANEALQSTSSARAVASPAEEEIPQEIEVPVQVNEELQNEEPFVQNEIPAQINEAFVQNSEPVQNESSDALTPDIDCEFGDSEPNQNSQNEKNPDSENQGQALFDIF